MAESLYYIYILQYVPFCTAHGAVMQQPIFKCLGVMVTAKPALTHIVENTCTVGTSGRRENRTMLTFTDIHVPLVLLVIVSTLLYTQPSIRADVNGVMPLAFMN